MQNEIYWSIDNSNFSYYDIDDLLNSNDHLIPGDVIFFGYKSNTYPSQFFDVHNLIEDMGNSAYDEFDELADDFPNMSKEKIKELNSLISNWLDHNVHINFFKIVNSEKYIITEQDVSNK